jgi:hypothetical protein
MAGGRGSLVGSANIMEETINRSNIIRPGRKTSDQIYVDNSRFFEGTNNSGVLFSENEILEQT